MTFLAPISETFLWLREWIAKLESTEGMRLQQRNGR